VAPQHLFLGYLPEPSLFQFNYCGVFNAYHSVKF
jgi:hypothetical protein